MAQFDTLMKGLGYFDQAVAKDQAKQEFADANRQLENIQANVQDRQLQQQKMNNLSFQLANNLAAAGVDAATIAQTAGRLGVSQSAQFQAQQNLEAQVQAQNFKALEAQKQRQFELMKERAKNQAAKTQLADFVQTGNYAVGKEDIKRLNRTSEDTRKIYTQAARVKELLNEVGTGEFGGELGIEGKKFAQLKSALRTMQLTAKGESQFGLGVLTGPDLELLEDITGAVGSITGGFQSTGATIAKVDEFIRNIGVNLESTAAARGFQVSPTSSINDLALKAKIPPGASQKLTTIENRFGGDPRLVTAIKAALNNPSNPRAQQLLRKYNINANDLLGE